MPPALIPPGFAAFFLVILAAPLLGQFSEKRRANGFHARSRRGAR
jgi:hypothetical protein